MSKSNFILRKIKTIKEDKSMGYYETIILLTIVSMGVMATVVGTSKNFKTRAQRGLIISFIIIILGAVSEFSVVILNERNLKMFAIRDILRFLKFIFMPIMPIIASKALFGKVKEDNLTFILGLIVRIYLMIGACLVVAGWFCFSVGGSSFAERRDFYETMMHNIYIVAFLISTLYMLVQAIQFSKAYQNKGREQLVAICCFVVLGAVVQILNRKLRTVWITIDITAVFLFIYYDELILCIDGLTGLLNQKCLVNYLTNEASERKRCIIIVFDVNDFKYINDAYGHSAGDEILIAVSDVLKDSYRNVGECYRMGGDEFAVIMLKDIEKIQQINEHFIKNLEEKRESLKKEDSKKKEEDRLPELPHISYGTAIYEPSNKKKQTLPDTQKLADADMYANKEVYYQKNPKRNLKKM